MVKAVMKKQFSDTQQSGEHSAAILIPETSHSSKYKQQKREFH